MVIIICCCLGLGALLLCSADLGDGWTSIQVFPVPPELQEDIQLTEDLLPMMAKNAGLVLLKLSSDGSELMALGSAFALDTAFVLINMHFVKAPQLAKFAHRANSLQSRMSDSNGSMMKGESVVFNTPQAYVGTMIGYRVLASAQTFYISTASNPTQSNGTQSARRVQPTGLALDQK